MELNQPILPNIRKWKGPRGCWKAVVADMPSTQLQKVPAICKTWIFICILLKPPLSLITGIYKFPLPTSLMQFCVSAHFLALCPSFQNALVPVSCLDREWTAAQTEMGVQGVGRRGEILSGAKAANGVFLSFVLLIPSPGFHLLPSLWRAHCSLTETFRFA